MPQKTSIHSFKPVYILCCVQILLTLFTSCRSPLSELDKYKASNIRRISSDQILEAVESNNQRIIRLVGEDPVSILPLFEMKDPLLVAYNNGNPELLHLLLDHPDLAIGQNVHYLDELCSLAVENEDWETLTLLLESEYPRKDMEEKLTEAFRTNSIDAMETQDWMSHQGLSISGFYNLAGERASRTNKPQIAGWSKEGSVMVGFPEMDTVRYSIINLITDEVEDTFSVKAEYGIGDILLEKIASLKIFPLQQAWAKIYPFPHKQNGITYDAFIEQGELLIYAPGLGTKTIAHVPGDSTITGYAQSPYESRIAVIVAMADEEYGVYGSNLEKRFDPSRYVSFKLEEIESPSWIAPPAQGSYTNFSGGSPGAEYLTQEQATEMGLTLPEEITTEYSYAGHQFLGWTPEGQVVIRGADVVIHTRTHYKDSEPELMYYDSRTGHLNRNTEQHSNEVLAHSWIMNEGANPGIELGSWEIKIKAPEGFRRFSDPRAYHPQLKNGNGINGFTAYSINPMNPDIIAVFALFGQNPVRFDGIRFCDLGKGICYPGMIESDF